MTPAVTVVVPEPVGTVAALTVIAVALALFGLEIYKTQRLFENFDQLADDADYAARTVDVHAERLDAHSGKLDEICDYLAALAEPETEPGVDTEPMPVVQPDTEPAPRVDVAGGLRAGRPTPYPRKGRHAA